MANPFDKKNSLINTAEDEFFESLKVIDQQLAREIIKIYAKFLVGGELMINAEQFAQLEQSIIAAVAKTNYKVQVDFYLRNFDAIQALNVEIHELLNGITVTDVIKESDAINNFVSQVTSQLKATPSTVVQVTNVVDGVKEVVKYPVRNSSLNELIDPIASLIRTDVITGITFEAATEAMLEAITKNHLGLERWAGQIAGDALSQADGVTQNEIRKEFSLKYISYEGNVIETTRPLCYHLVSKGPVWTVDQLDKELKNFVVDGIPVEGTTTKTANGKQQRKGSGIIPGTDIDNFLIYRGGYRCRHNATPAKRAPLKN